MKSKSGIFLLLIAGLALTVASSSPFPAWETPAYAQVNKSKKDASAKGKEDAPPAVPKKIELPDQSSAIHPETFRMIETIERKNRELKKREEEILLKEEQLKFLEAKILSDLDRIENALARSQELLGIQNERVVKNIKALVKAYSAMKPKEAAKLLEAVDEELAIQIISGMKGKVAGKVLSQLNVKVAKSISEKLAGKNK